MHSGAFAGEFVPLGLATRLISARAYGADAAAMLHRLTGIAHTMAALIPLYVHATDGSRLRRLTDRELHAGFFRKDGGELHFTDGRPPIKNIAARHQDIEQVVRLLASAVDTEEGARGLLRAR
jgi:hypothetical protein